LMDEPLSALDKELRSHMQLELKRIQQDLGVTVIYVTHDQGEALSMSDRLAVMNHGRIEQLGAPKELYEKPVNRFVAGFLGESNLLRARVEQAGPDAVQVRSGRGISLQGTAQGQLSKGDDVVLAIRPEKIVLADPDQASPGLVGEIRVASYGGDSIRYVIDVNGEELIAKVPNFSSHRPYATGERVSVQWAPSDALIYSQGTL